MILTESASLASKWKRILQKESEISIKQQDVS